jgi:hypothetical protein
MTPSINWSCSDNNAAGDEKIHFAECTDQLDVDIQHFINGAIDQAIGIIPQSIRDDARYLLFTWDDAAAELTIVSTDDDKVNDAKECVRVCIHHWCQQDGASAEQVENVHFWIRDYLTTCPEFLHYSLIAVFTCGDRASARLL